MLAGLDWTGHYKGNLRITAAVAPLNSVIMSGYADRPNTKQKLPLCGTLSIRLQGLQHLVIFHKAARQGR